MLSTLFSTLGAKVGAAAVLTLSAGTAAAATGNLPAEIQQKVADAAATAGVELPGGSHGSEDILLEEVSDTADAAVERRDDVTLPEHAENGEHGETAGSDPSVTGQGLDTADAAAGEHGAEGRATARTAVENGGAAVADEHRVDGPAKADEARTAERPTGEEGTRQRDGAATAEDVQADRPEPSGEQELGEEEEGGEPAPQSTAGASNADGHRPS